MVVLIVDDDPVSLLVAEHIVRSGGWDVIAATDAASALEAWRAHDPEIIVCDYNMPDASGLDVLEALAEQSALDDRRCPPFVLLTGVGEEHELDDPRAGHVSGYLTKPVQSSDLLGLIERLVSRDLPVAE